MGPGGLEVKRYIGSCLISGGRDVPVPLCGLPLVAVPPLSRLALHTHGAPLILAGRGRRPAPRHHQSHNKPPQHNKPQAPAAAPPPATAGDSPSTASDESSGPADAALPRIIKPRKRRKKDRKPAATAPASTPSAREGSSIVTLRPYVPLCYEGAAASKPPQQTQPQQRSKPQAVPAPPPQQAPASACQCRYCDPRGHIWDVRRHCYSAVLTPPPESAFASIPLFLAAPPTGAAAADSDAGFCSEGLPALRRSFSACSTSSSSSSSSAGDASQGLQVSTEIVTSPNGHRDLEIRFYSCSPPADADADTSAGAAAAGAACSEEASDSEQEGDGECAEKLLGESLWANIVQEE